MNKTPQASPIRDPGTYRPGDRVGIFTLFKTSFTSKTGWAANASETNAHALSERFFWVILQDSIEMNATGEDVFAFFEGMDQERYLGWHPDHKLFRWTSGQGLLQTGFAS